MSGRNPGRRGFYGEGDSGSDGGADGSGDADTSPDPGSSPAPPGGVAPPDGGGGDGGSGGDTSPDPGSSPAPPGGVAPPDDGGGDGGSDGSGDAGTSPDPGSSPAPPGGVAPPDDDGGGNDRDFGGGGDGGSGPTPDGQTSPPGGRAPPSQRGDVREPADRVPGGQPTDDGRGFSGDPNPQGGIADDVPTRARGQAQDLRQEAADQYRGAVGPEDIRVTYDEESQRLSTEVTASGVRELGARDLGVEPSEVRAEVRDPEADEGDGLGYDISLTGDAQEEAAEERVASDIGVDASEVEVSEREADAAPPGGVAPQGFDVDLSEQAQEQLRQQRIERQEEALEESNEQLQETLSEENITRYDTESDSFGQTTDPDFDPEEARGGEFSVGDFAREVTIGQLSAGFSSLGEEGREAIDTGTAERVAGTETVIPDGVVEGLQDAGNFVATGTTEAGTDRGGIAGAYADIGGLEGAGETLAGGVSTAAFAPSRAVASTAADVGVPGADQVEGAYQFAEEDVVEPGLSGVLGDAPAAVAEAPGEAALLAERSIQAGTVIADDPGTAEDIGRTAVGFGGVAAEQSAAEFEENPVRTTAEVGTLVGGGYAVSRTAGQAVGTVRNAPDARTGLTGYAANELDPRVTALGDFRGVGSELASRASGSVRNVLAEERGVGQLPRSLRRSDSEEPEISAEDIEPDLGRPSQQSVPRRESRDRGSFRRRGGSGYGEPGSGGRSGGRRTGRGLDERTRGRMARREEAEAPEVVIPEQRGGTFTGVASGLLAGETADQALAQDQVLGVREGILAAPRTEIGPMGLTQTRAATDIDARTDLDTEVRPRTDFDPDPDLDRDFDPRTDPDPDFNRDRDFDLEFPEPGPGGFGDVARPTGSERFENPIADASEVLGGVGFGGSTLAPEDAPRTEDGLFDDGPGGI